MLKDIRKVIKKHFKDILFCISILSLTVIFSNTLAQYIDKLFVSVDLYSLSFIIPIAVLVICIIAYTAYLWQNNFVPSKNLLFATYCFGLVLYRTKLNDRTIFVYADIILLLYLCQSVLLIKHVIKKHKQEEENNKVNTTNGFISDTPVIDPKNDNKGYNGYALNIANKIKESHFENSFAIGLNGKWGSGKTSMSNLIKRHLKDEKDIVPIDFKPWNSNTPDAIIKDFFETLQDELSQYHAALSRLLIRYSRKLTSIDSNIITQTIEYAANYILDLDATNKVYEKINKALQDINKKIIIYIDDLDRLAQSEIMEVIRLIRNTANFYNTFFIVTYDKDYVNDALEKADIHNHEKFLEKIFQLEVNLPYYDKTKLIDELKNKLIKQFPEKEEEITKALTLDENKKYAYDRDKGPKPITIMLIDNWLNNSRDITRLCNSFMLNYSRVKDYVVFKEFLLIEILRINEPDGYEKLFKMKEDIFKKLQNFKPKKLNENFFIIEGKNEKINSLIKYIFGHPGYNYLLEIEENLLDQNSSHSITHIKRFPIYFNNFDISKFLSYPQFLEAFDEGEDHFLNKIEEWINLDYRDDLIYCFGQNLSFGLKEDFKKYIRGLILAHSLKLKIAHLFDPLLFENNNVKNLYEGDYKIAMSECFYPFNEDSDIKFYFILDAFPKNYHDNHMDVKTKNNLDKWGELEEIHIQVFKVILESTNKFSQADALYDRIEINMNTLNKQIVVKSLQEFIFTSDFEGYIQSLMFQSKSDGTIKYSISDDNIEDIFEEVSIFEDVLLQKKDDSEITKEFYEFYYKCKENDFDETDFSFNKIPIKEWIKQNYQN